MITECFLKIGLDWPTIKGGSLNVDHPDWLEVVSYYWDVVSWGVPRNGAGHEINLVVSLPNGTNLYDRAVCCA
jgi:hypothetical protein